jgi:hypothetical protein
MIFIDPKGANNQIKDKFDSVIRSHQQSSEQSDGIPLREDLDDDEDDEASNNDNNNSSGSIDESEISINQ